MSEKSIGYWDNSDRPASGSTGYRDPFYTLTHSLAGTTQSTPSAYVSMPSSLNEPSLQAIREIVREEVRKALAGISNGREPDGLSGK